MFKLTEPKREEDELIELMEELIVRIFMFLDNF